MAVNELAMAGEQVFLDHWHSISLKGKEMSMFQVWVLVPGLLNPSHPVHHRLAGLTQPHWLTHNGKGELHVLTALPIMEKPKTTMTNANSSRAANIYVINCYQKCQLKVNTKSQQI